MAAFEHFKVIEGDYRMPPKYPYPAAMDDAMAVYKALLTTTDPAHIAVFGTSTGGGMTLALMLRAKADLQVFEGFSHASYALDPFIPESREAFEEIARFLSAHLAK